MKSPLRFSITFLIVFQLNGCSVSPHTTVGTLCLMLMRAAGSPFKVIPCFAALTRYSFSFLVTVTGSSFVLNNIYHDQGISQEIF